MSRCTSSATCSPPLDHALMHVISYVQSTTGPRPDAFNQQHAVHCRIMSWCTSATCSPPLDNVLTHTSDMRQPLDYVLIHIISDIQSTTGLCPDACDQQHPVHHWTMSWSTSATSSPPLDHVLIHINKNTQSTTGWYLYPHHHKWLWWSRGSVLAFSTQVRGFKPDWSRWIFKGEKILSTPSFGGQVKPSVPCRRFAAHKRTLNVLWKSSI
jgi:hypothetical protein